MIDSQSDEELQTIFLNPESLEFLSATGFRQSIIAIGLKDRSSLITCLTDHHCLLKVKAEMDQFLLGLASLGISERIKNDPETLKCLFVANDSHIITAGKVFLSDSKVNINFYVHVDKLKDIVHVNYPSTSLAKQKAEQTWIFFSDFLDLCQGTQNVCQYNYLVLL